MFFLDHVSPHKHLLLNVAAVFTLGKLMNVKEDYGELSSVARSVHVIDKSILLLFLRYCKDCTQFANLRESCKSILIFPQLHSGRDLGVHAAVYMVVL